MLFFSLVFFRGHSCRIIVTWHQSCGFSPHFHSKDVSASLCCVSMEIYKDATPSYPDVMWQLLWHRTPYSMQCTQFNRALMTSITICFCFIIQYSKDDSCWTLEIHKTAEIHPLKYSYGLDHNSMEVYFNPKKRLNSRSDVSPGHISLTENKPTHHPETLMANKVEI